MPAQRLLNLPRHPLWSLLCAAVGSIWLRMFDVKDYGAVVQLYKKLTAKVFIFVFFKHLTYFNKNTHKHTREQTNGWGLRFLTLT